MNNAIIGFLLLQLSLLAEDPNAFRFIVAGDTGSGTPSQQAVAERIKQWKEDHPYHDLFMLGDNIYGGSGRRGGHKDLFADRFDRPYNSLRKDIQFHAVLGNHDRETEQGRHEIEDPEHRFGFDGKKSFYVFQPPGHEELIAFFALNSEADYEEQIAWLKNALATCKSRWKIAFFHSPMYTPPGGHSPRLKFRNEFESILAGGGVQLVLSGHNHFYARMKPIHKMIHIISGAGGRGLYKVDQSERDCATELFRDDVHSFLYLEANPEKIAFWAISSTGERLDYGEINDSYLRTGLGTCQPWNGSPALSQFPHDMLGNVRGVFSVANVAPLLIGGTIAGASVPLDDRVKNYFLKDRRAKAYGDAGEVLGGYQVVLGVNAGLLFTGRILDRSRFRSMTYSLAQATTINLGLTQIVKGIVRREPPNGEDNFSFPSGHSSNAFSSATVISSYYGLKAAIPAYIAAAFISSSRIEKSKHHLSDVAAGATLGYIVGRTVTRRQQKQEFPRLSWGIVPVPGGGMACTAAINLGRP